MSDPNKPRTICWDCSKACGECSWSDHWKHKPVKGWKAIRNDLHCKDITVESYVVLECPEFERDAYDYGARRIGRWHKHERSVQKLQIQQTEE